MLHNQPSPERNEALNNVLKFRAKEWQRLDFWHVCDLVKPQAGRKADERKDGDLGAKNGMKKTTLSKAAKNLASPLVTFHVHVM